jgi:hypothetical protein
MSEQFGVPVQELTWDHLKQMPRDVFRQLLAHPEGKAKVDSLIADRKAAADARERAENAGAEQEEVPTAVAVATLTPEEEAAAQAAETASRLAAEAAVAAEAARLAAEAEAAKPKKFVIDFQAEDENGNPIGNRTHLEASSQEELLEKMKTSYVNAARAVDRLKKQKPTFKKDEVIKAPTEADLKVYAEDINSDDPAKRLAAVRAIAAHESAAAKAEAEAEKQKTRAEAVSLRFLKNHILDYNNCQANNDLMGAYILDNNLEWTEDNLEIAFGNIESQLAPVVRREAPVQVPAPTVVANTTATEAAAAPVVPAVAAVPVAPAAPAAPAVVAPVTPVAPAPNTPVAQPVNRSGVNGGIVPGQTTTGVKPAAREPELTKKDIAKMSADEMKRRHRIDPKFYDKVNALFAKKA